MVSISETAKERIKYQLQAESFDSNAYCPVYDWAKIDSLNGAPSGAEGFHLTLFEVEKLDQFISLSIVGMNVGFFQKSVFDGTRP